MTEASRIDASVKDERRVLRPNRTQLELRPVDLEDLPRPGRRARIVWEFVEGLDLGPLCAQIRAGEGHAGRPAINPSILMAL
jgi:transposase